MQKFIGSVNKIPNIELEVQIYDQGSGTNADAVVAVPVQAVKYEESTDRDAPAKSSLFVVKDGRVKQRTVETDIADDAYIAVPKGLAAGEQIAVGPARVLRFLRDGERVKPAPVVEEAAGKAAATQKPGEKASASAAR